jgi:hypothetical protein
MNGEINRELYCARYCCKDRGNEYFCLEQDMAMSFQHCKSCICCHRKHPTPEQFREEYGEEYPDDGAVYVFYTNEPELGWAVSTYKYTKDNLNFLEGVVCACTPWGKPPNGWRPE